MNKSLIQLLFALSLGFAGMLLAVQAVYAQSNNCAPHAKVLERLTTQFKESRKAMGLTSKNTIMELYAAETGTWSLLATLPNGITCVMASGQHFETHSAPLPPQGEPS